MDQVKGGCEWSDEVIDLSFDLSTVGIEFIDVVKTLTELNCLLVRDGTVNGGLNFGDRSFTVGIHERRNVERLPRMRQNELGDGTCGLSEHVGEHIVEFQVGDSETVLSAILLAGDHVGQLHAVANQITKLANDGRRNKAGFDHAAHEQIADPAGILAVGLVALHGFGVLGMGENDLAGLFEDVEHRNPVLPRRFHAHLRAVQTGKPFREFSQTLGKGSEACFVILSDIAGIGDTNAGKDPSLVNVKAAAVVSDDFEHGVPPVT